MKIIRPHDAEDNQTNIEMTKILERFLKKNNMEIETLEIYGLSVVANTTDGKIYQMNQADGCRFGTTDRQKHFWYMTEKVNGKKTRVKKERW